MALRPKPCQTRQSKAGRRLRRSALFGTILISSSPVPADDADWLYGAYLDISYADDLGGSRSLEWRSKLTTRYLNSFAPNMGMAYLHKLPSDQSRWGMEFGLQGGNDMDAQKPAAGQNPIPGADVLTYLSRANVSYLAPVGNGLKLKAGLMNSFIGFESMYAGQNPNYTRAWIADYSPYFLIGAGGEYQIRNNLLASFYVLTDYDYLAFSGDAPKYGGQIKWGFAPGWTLTQNIFFGPEQENTGLAFWRGFSDSIVHWQGENVMVAMAYDIGSTKRDTTGLQALWMGSALWTHWHIDGPWSVALRPEVYWDPNGQMTGSEQFIGAITATTEYKLPVGPTSASFRMEFRHDTSTGPEGGFFNAASTQPALVPGQNLLFFALIWTYDGKQ